MGTSTETSSASTETVNGELERPRPCDRPGAAATGRSTSTRDSATNTLPAYMAVF